MGHTMKTADQCREEGNAFFKSKAYQDALTCYNEALSLDAQSAKTNFNKGLTLKYLGRIDEAISAFELAARYDESYSKAWFQLRELYFEQQRFDKSVLAYEKMILLDPKNVQLLLKKEKVENRVAAKIFYGVTDLKLTEDNKVNMLELGEGLWSGLSQHATLYPEQPALAAILHETLRRYNPRVSINHQRSNETPASEDEVREKLGTTELTQDFDLTDIGRYAGIYGSQSIGDISQEILKLNDMPAISLSCEDKGVFFHLMNHGDLIKHLPESRLYTRKYEATLAKKIITSLHADMYVIKALDMNNANGVLFVKSADLDVVLKMLLLDVESAAYREAVATYCRKYPEAAGSASTFLGMFSDSGASPDIMKFSNWRGGHSTHFMVQRYCASKNIKTKKGTFDPTMRVAFLYVSDKANSTFIPLTMYWKLPQSPVGDKSLDFRKSHVSTIEHSAVVSNADRQTVTAQLSTVFPKLFERIRCFEPLAYYEAQGEALDGDKHGIQLTLLANNYGFLGRYKIAMHLLKRAIKANPSHQKAYHELGIVNLQMGNFDVASQYFTKAISLGATGASYERRAEAYEGLGQYGKALENLDKVHPMFADANDLERAQACRARIASKMPGLKLRK